MLTQVRRALDPTTAKGKDAIRLAGDVIRSGQLVAFPTETVYGLGADALSAQAVQRIYRAKGRPSDNPVIVHISDFDMVDGLARNPPHDLGRLADAFWPGPLTVVLKASPPARRAATAGLDTVALRMPKHRVARHLIRAAKVPIAAPSANRSGRPSPTSANDVLEALDGRIPLILDGGRCEIGIESTVLDLSEGRPRVLRPGTITASAISDVLGVSIEQPQHYSSPRSPGTRHPHYRPRTRLLAVDHLLSTSDVDRYLKSTCGQQQIGYITTRPGLTNLPAVVYRHRQTTARLTQMLYADLLELDRLQLDLILVDEAPGDEAIDERIRRASAGRLRRSSRGEIVPSSRTSTS